MVQIKGKYRNVHQENLEEFFEALGCPYHTRKMLTVNSPTLDIDVNEDGNWSIAITSFIHKNRVHFQLDQEYEETFFNCDNPKTKSVTRLKDNVLETNCFDSYDVVVTKTYKFTDEGCILTMTHKPSGATAKQVFSKAN